MFITDAFVQRHRKKSNKHPGRLLRHRGLLASQNPGGLLHVMLPGRPILRFISQRYYLRRPTLTTKRQLMPQGIQYTFTLVLTMICGYRACIVKYC